MMEFIYHIYWNIAFALGLFVFIVVFGQFIFNLIKGDIGSINKFSEKGVGYILFYIILEILLSFLLTYLEY